MNSETQFIIGITVLGILLIAIVVYIALIARALIKEDEFISPEMEVTHPDNVIVLTKDCFDDINVPCVTPCSILPSWDGYKYAGQANTGTDCPIYRACKNMGIDVGNVHNDIHLNNGERIVLNVKPMDLENCRLQLLNGAEYAYIYKV